MPISGPSHIVYVTLNNINGVVTPARQPCHRFNTKRPLSKMPRECNSKINLHNDKTGQEAKIRKGGQVTSTGLPSPCAAWDVSGRQANQKHSGDAWTHNSPAFRSFSWSLGLGLPVSRSLSLSAHNCSPVYKSSPVRSGPVQFSLL